VQLRSWSRPAALALTLCGACAAPGHAFTIDDQPMAGSMLRLFTDSDKVGVRSWIGNCSMSSVGSGTLSLNYNNERVTIPAIQAPIGSQEAVDAITTASRPISGNAFQDYVKVRNEVEGQLEKGPASFQYYVSSESDYLAQQVSASVNRDYMNEQLNLSIGSSYGWDAIDPLADDDTQAAPAHKNTIHWNAVATQVVTPTTLVRLGVEANVVSGLQHNPYRNVYAGGTNVPERHPDHRFRRDAFLKLNQYLNNRSSLKLNYRLYNDDWGIISHELGSKLSQYVTHGLSATYEYRWYTQSSADFYRDEYVDPQGVDGYRSGDYRMAALSSHLFGVTLSMDLDAFVMDNALLRRLALRFNYDRYFNSNNYSANILETGLDYRF
jgi:hypothetical protein